MEFSINVFTLNCWAIPVVSKNRRERLEALVTYLNESPHDVVCLQEIWSESDFIFLRESLDKAFPYSHYFYSGVLGSGLCMFSKWVIQDVFFHQWPLNGYIHKVHHADWFGGKGVGLCRLKLNDRLINVYCAHLHAEYHEDDMYLAHRVLQSHSMAEFINVTTGPADVAIVAGDFNTGPGDLSFRMITQLPPLQDPYDLHCEGTNPHIRKATGTSNNTNNSYSDPKQIQKAPEGKRIDHILFHVNPKLQAQIMNFGNPLSDRVPGQPFSYSDHNAVTLELKLRPSKSNGLTKEFRRQQFEVLDIIAEAIKVCEEAKEAITKSKTMYVTLGSLAFMFLLGTVGYWPRNLCFDVVKILVTGFCFYCLVMGTLWNKIELNNVKAGLSALENYRKSNTDYNIH